MVKGIYLRKLIALQLGALGLALLALARWIAGYDRPNQTSHYRSSGLIYLPRSHYRTVSAPGRLEVYRTWLVVLFSAWKFAAIGA